MEKLGNEIIKSALVNEFDFIDMSYKNARLEDLKRGVLKKQMIGGISPCVKISMINYGVVVMETLKNKLCNKILKEKRVKENDVIQTSYANERLMKPEERLVEKNNEAPTISTRADTLGVVVKENNDKNKIKVLGNYKPSQHECGRVVDKSGITPTMKENHGAVITTMTDNLRIRKLTPKECWRLMSFSDEDYDKASKVCSQCQLYKQAGNSIVVKVLEEIFKKLFKDTHSSL